MLHRAAALALLLAPVSSAPCSIASPPYSAACDNRTEDTAAIQRALDDLSCATVIVPASCAAYTRSLSLAAMSHRTLLIEGSLEVWRDPATYGAPHGGYNNPVLAGSSSGIWTGPLLEGFTLTGGGTVRGGGAAWWKLGQTVNRPRTIWVPNASNLVIANLTFMDSPAWNIGVRGNGVHISGMTVRAGSEGFNGAHEGRG